MMIGSLGGFLEFGLRNGIHGIARFLETQLVGSRSYLKHIIIHATSSLETVEI